jgi:hypothetical protein
MFGRILGKIISTPVRLVNVPLKVLDDITDPVRRPLRERDPIKLDEIADAIDDACDEDDD